MEKATEGWRQCRENSWTPEKLYLPSVKFLIVKPRELLVDFLWKFVAIKFDSTFKLSPLLFDIPYTSFYLPAVTLTKLPPAITWVSWVSRRKSISSIERFLCLRKDTSGDMRLPHLEMEGSHYSFYIFPGRGNFYRSSRQQVVSLHRRWTHSLCGMLFSLQTRVERNWTNYSEFFNNYYNNRGSRNRENVRVLASVAFRSLIR